MDNYFDIEVEIRGEIKDGYRLKVSVRGNGLGIYMDGFRATQPKPPAWWIQAPSFKAGYKWVTIPEFDKHERLWLEIEEKCIDTVEATADNVIEVKDEDLTEEALARWPDEVMKEIEQKELKQLDLLDENDEKEPPKAMPWLKDDD